MEVIIESYNNSSSSIYDIDCCGTQTLPGCGSYCNCDCNQD